MVKTKHMTEMGKKCALPFPYLHPSLFPIRDACVHTSSSNHSPRSTATDLYVALLPHHQAQPRSNRKHTIHPRSARVSVSFLRFRLIAKGLSARKSARGRRRAPIMPSPFRKYTDCGAPIWCERERAVRCTLLRFTLNISIYTTYVYCMDTACSCRSLVAELEATVAADLG